MTRSAIQNDPPSPFRSAALSRISRRRVLRIGYAAACPWIFRTAHGLRGHDAAAAAALAHALQAEPWFVECPRGDLPELLSTGHIDVAVGGLVNCGWAEVSCVRARHVVEDEAEPGRRRQVFFPNVWWVDRTDPVWRLRVAAFLLAHRSRSRAGAAHTGGA